MKNAWINKKNIKSVMQLMERLYKDFEECIQDQKYHALYEENWNTNSSLYDWISSWHKDFEAFIQEYNAFYEKIKINIYKEYNETQLTIAIMWLPIALSCSHCNIKDKVQYYSNQVTFFSPTLIFIRQEDGNHYKTQSITNFFNADDISTSTSTSTSVCSKYTVPLSPITIAFLRLIYPFIGELCFSQKLVKPYRNLNMVRGWLICTKRKKIILGCGKRGMKMACITLDWVLTVKSSIPKDIRVLIIRIVKSDYKQDQTDWDNMNQLLKS